MDSIHDLRDQPGWERRLKRAVKRRLSSIPPERWANYGQHDFFQIHIKAQEMFTLVGNDAFMEYFAPLNIRPSNPIDMVNTML